MSFFHNAESTVAFTNHGYYSCEGSLYSKEDEHCNANIPLVNEQHCGHPAESLKMLRYLKTIYNLLTKFKKVKKGVAIG